MAAADKPEGERVQKEMEEDRKEKDAGERLQNELKELHELVEQLKAECRLQDETKKAADGCESPTENPGNTTDQTETQHDFSKCYFSELEYILNISEEPDVLDACERELDKRWEAYNAWKAKNAPEEEEDDDDSEFPRPKIPSEGQNMGTLILCLSRFATMGEFVDEYLAVGWADESVC